jgi:hypothetical protein
MLTVPDTPFFAQRGHQHREVDAGREARDGGAQLSGDAASSSSRAVALGLRAAPAA